MSRIAIVGMGYLGCTLAAWLTSKGHEVHGIEAAPARLSALRGGMSPVYEPGLDAALSVAVGEGTLVVHETLTEVRDAFDLFVVAVNTPSGPDGDADLRQVREALRRIVDISSGVPIVVRSTLPPGASDALLYDTPELAERYHYIPDFFRQGHALKDLANPQRVIVGFSGSTAPSTTVMATFTVPGTPTIQCSCVSAEAIKYASNAFLAMKISYANEVADLCDASGADVDDVLLGMGLDARIGRTFLQAGLGFGDSCLPKDTRAYQAWGGRVQRSTDLIDATIRRNTRQRGLVLRMLDDVGWPFPLKGRAAIWGVRYLTSSDDMREAPAGWVVPQIHSRFDSVTIWDGADRTDLGLMFPGCDQAPTPEAAARDACVVIVLGRWPRLREIDWDTLGGALGRDCAILDPTNFLDGRRIRASGLRYLGFGRSRR